MSECAQKSQVLTLVGTYSPGYKAGGPLRSIENLVAALGEEFQFRIVTLDRDLGERSPFPGIVTNRWVHVGQAEVMYLPPGLRGLLAMWELLRLVDRNTVLYLNSFLSARFSVLPVVMCWLMLCRPRCLVLAPRGEFSPGAMQFKRIRKHLYIRASRLFGLHRGLIWQASSTLEMEDIQRQFPQTEHIEVESTVAQLDSLGRRRISAIATASDIAGAVSPRLNGRPPKKPGQLRAVFVSRLSPKKNLSGALRMLGSLTGDIAFDIYGPAEDPDYWEECGRLIAALPDNIRVRYRGAVEHAAIQEVFAKYDLLLFPTLGENFGHVIYESLAAGCPVLISDQTPWRDLEAQGVGWEIPLAEPERFGSVLQQCVDAGDERLAALSRRAMDYAARLSSDPNMIDANRKLFQWAFAWPDPA